MATQTPQPPLTPEQRIALEEREQWKSFGRKVAIAGVVICPAVILMPPRKLDMYTFSLGLAFYLSADHLATSYTGRGVLFQFSKRPESQIPSIEKTSEAQKILKEGREALKNGSTTVASNEDTNKNPSMLHRLWMGNEKADWKEKRMEEERQALAEGKSYTDMILGQIWEVWNPDKNKDGEKKEAEVTKSEKKE